MIVIDPKSLCPPRGKKTTLHSRHSENSSRPTYSVFYFVNNDRQITPWLFIGFAHYFTRFAPSDSPSSASRLHPITSIGKDTGKLLNSKDENRKLYLFDRFKVR